MSSVNLYTSKIMLLQSEIKLFLIFILTLNFKDKENKKNSGNMYKNINFIYKTSTKQ